MFNLRTKNITKTTEDNLGFHLGEQTEQGEISQEQELLLEAVLYKQRSQEYVEALYHLDLGDIECDQKKINALIEKIASEFPETEVSVEDYLIGIIAKCYIGPTYTVHTLNYAQQILRHYQQGESLPEGLDKGLILAQSGRFAFVEIYTNCCCGIDARGNVSLLKIDK